MKIHDDPYSTCYVKVSNLSLLIEKCRVGIKFRRETYTDKLKELHEQMIQQYNSKRVGLFWRKKVYLTDQSALERARQDNIRFRKDEKFYIKYAEGDEDDALTTKFLNIKRAAEYALQDSDYIYLAVDNITALILNDMNIKMKWPNRGTNNAKSDD